MAPKYPPTLQPQRVNQKSLLRISVVSIVLFLILGMYANNPIILEPNLPYPVEYNSIQKADYSIAHAVNQNRNPGLTSFMTSITHIGDTAFASRIIIITLILLALFAHRRYLVALVLGSGLVVIATSVFKIIFDRPRPGTMDGDILPQMVIAVAGKSYPSGHAAIATFLFIFFAWLIAHHIKNRTVKIVGASLIGIVAVFICFSRIYLGVHFTSDVIGGILLATGLTSISLWIIRAYIPRLS